MMNSAEIRQHFLDFFKSKGHHIVPSAPIVIKNDPTLLFTNAGMNQFKEYFLGNRPAPYSRIADTQKCLRVSGKHNDLEEVGVDTYHHTMFEMLGNWSFGNSTSEPAPYFKEKAIEWAWELLTKIYKIPVEDLYVTVFEGDEKDGLPKDDESLSFWKRFVAEVRILFGNKKDNFWEMGDTGPCGPSTEIHVDCRSAEEKKLVPGKELINKDNPQVIEIWNVVFIQFNRKKDGSLELLPAKHVDTGMGFERLVRVLQNKKSNYDTDIFKPTIEEIEHLSGKEYDYSGSKQAIAFRVIADHIRAIAFPIADGQLPSNTGAGYVIRRILRRAVRYYFSYLDVKEPLLFKLVSLIAEQFQNVFPELNKQKEFVAKVIHEEETNFLRTLDSGLKKLEAIVESKENINGKTAFELFDTYGFPLDLTKLIAAENNLSIDEAGFEKEMQQQKNRSRAASVVDAEDWVVLSEEEANGFVGYEKQETQSKVLRYRKLKTKGKELFQIVLDTTPFYAESGGQMGDTGELIFENEKIPVINTKKENELVLHFTERLPSNISSKVLATIDIEKRNRTAVHHSATHLLHAALRKVLGTHVQQKGSLVNADYLRFDFSHFSKMTNEEIESVEMIVNEKIRQNIPVVIRQMPKEEAMKTGAMALFGEKYGDLVRVVTMDENYSIELCGGTHVGNTGELGFFKITTETAVGTGLRRIEAMSGKAAEDFVNAHLEELNNLKEQLKNPKDSLKALENLITEKEKLSKQINQLELQILDSINEQLRQNFVLINGVHFLGSVVDVSNADGLKKLASLLKENCTNYLILLAANIDGKANVVLAVDDEFIDSKKTDAVKIIKEHVAPLIKGGGGGQKTLASAGGQDVSHFNEVIEKVKSLL
ncbi:MAG: alanine--tRNA ligase [Ginsengibacter sp.]